MTLEDFRAKTKYYRRLEFVSVTIFVALMSLACMATISVGKRIDRFGFDTTCILILAVSYPLVAALMYYFMAIQPKRQLRQLGLTCPTCKARLTGFSSQVVIASEHCGHCGSHVLRAKAE